MQELTRTEAVTLAGEKLVSMVEKENCELSMRVMEDGTQEYTACHEGWQYRVTVYYYQDSETVENIPHDDMEWEVSYYTVEAS